jgi:hypothetical protein
MNVEKMEKKMEKKGANIKIKQFNKEILKELMYVKPKAYSRAKERFPNIEDWMTGKDYPTYNEVSELSKIFKIPFGYFFFEKFPKYSPPVPIPNDEDHDDIISVVQYAERVQEWAKDILIEYGWEENDFDFSKVEINRTDDLQVLIDEIEKNHIYVLMFDIGEYAGFVLYDNIVPVIVINSANAIEGKIDTLMEAVKYIKDKKSDVISGKVYRTVAESDSVISKRFLELLENAADQGIIMYIDVIRLTRFDD